jgi:ribosomal protein S12 methylthiotransferase accessory factor YcaO
MVPPYLPRKFQLAAERTLEEAAQEEAGVPDGGVDGGGRGSNVNDTKTEAQTFRYRS